MNSKYQKLILLGLFIFSGMAPKIFNFNFDYCLWCDVDYLFSYDFNYVSSKGNSRLYLLLYQLGFSLRILIFALYVVLFKGPESTLSNGWPIERYYQYLAVGYAIKDCVDEVGWHNVTYTQKAETIVLVFLLLLPVIFSYGRRQRNRQEP